MKTVTESVDHTRGVRHTTIATTIKGSGDGEADAALVISEGVIHVFAELDLDHRQARRSWEFAKARIEDVIYSGGPSTRKVKDNPQA